MIDQPVKQFSPQPRPWHWAACRLLGLMVLSLSILWWPAEAGDASEGAPRLVVDRTEIDLGDLPYGQRTTAVFTLTNAGQGVLKIIEDPAVEAIKGC
ncbi:MAG TPA: hypothetical protein VLK82_03285 [Candidatus Tectomicrobia bacterium]|nr:hypothetical protein [Candidatus Tectomicrobia bacterium]